MTSESPAEVPAIEEEADDGLWAVEGFEAVPTVVTFRRAPGKVRRRKLASAGGTSEPVATANDGPDVFTAKDLWERFRLDRRTIDRWQKAGKFPLHFRVNGKKSLWIAAEVWAWLHSQPRHMPPGKSWEGQR